MPRESNRSHLIQPYDPSQLLKNEDIVLSETKCDVKSEDCEKADHGVKLRRSFSAGSTTVTHDGIKELDSPHRKLF